VSCLDCQRDFEAAAIYETLGDNFSPPVCDACGGFLKSATISFGQSMPEDAMKQAQAWTERAEVFIVLGSSLQVQPAASFPVIAKRHGALLAIINRDETPLDDLADFNERGSIGEFFKELNPRLFEA
jgi:NAD-dependent deacetylase